MFQVTERDRTRGAGFLRDARIHTQHSCRMKPVAETLEALWWRPEAETVCTPRAPRPLSVRPHSPKAIRQPCGQNCRLVFTFTHFLSV